MSVGVNNSKEGESLYCGEEHDDIVIFLNWGMWQCLGEDGAVREKGRFKQGEGPYVCGMKPGPLRSLRTFFYS